MDGGEAKVITKAPSLKARLPKPKIREDRQKFDDEPYRNYIRDFAEDLRDGMVYMFGDYPRED